MVIELLGWWAVSCVDVGFGCRHPRSAMLCRGPSGLYS
ncbi:hypothetical protein I546_2694 [Mycobacterium kansasii 732]|nr:hypothetical protein I546_2694 [Mycobacterium kansasii 732]